MQAVLFSRFQAASKWRRSLHTTVNVCAGRNWRLAQDKGWHAHEHSELSEIPDWSYADGRLAPLEPEVIRRRQKMAQFTEKAMQLMAEMKETKHIHIRSTKQNSVKQELIEGRKFRRRSNQAVTTPSR